MSNISYLNELCKIWGLLYVYHPSVVRGDFDVNFETSLTKLLRKYLSIATDETFAKAVKELISILKDENADLVDLENNVTPDKNLDYKGFLLNRVHLGFSEDSTNGPYRNYWNVSYLNSFNPSTIDIRVNSKYKLRYTPDIYVKQDDPDKLARILQTKLSTHKPEDISNLSVEEKLLGLFKTWNVFKYFFPHYKDIQDKWEDNLENFIFDVLNSSSTEDYIHIIEKLTSISRDAHVRLKYDENIHAYAPKHSWTFPIQLNKVENKIIVLSSKDSKFNVGDEIIEINNKSIEEIEQDLRPLVSCSTEASFNWHLYGFLNGVFSGRENEKVTIKYKSKGSVKETKLTYSLPWDYWKNNSPNPVSNIYNKNGKKVGYINLAKPKTGEEFEVELEKVFTTDSLILDLRCYPQFWTGVSILPRICKEGAASGNFKVKVIEGPTVAEYSTLTVKCKDGINNFSYFIPVSSKPVYLKPIAVLVDFRTKSSPEDLCIYLKNLGRCTFIGSETSGTNGNVTSFKIPGDIKVKFTGMDVTYADDSPFQRIGVPIDIEVKPTIEGITKGEDEVIERALDYLFSLD